MYRPRRSRTTVDNLNLDSLMDVLSCSVGVMLFIVVFAVIEARGTNVLEYSPPLLREPPGNSQRILALCKDERVRILDVAFFSLLLSQVAVDFFSTRSLLAIRFDLISLECLALRFL